MAWRNPSSAVRGENNGARAVGFTETLARGTAPHGSRSRCGSSGHTRLPAMSAASISTTLPGPPERLELGQRFAGRRSGDELAGHALDVATRHRGRQAGAEGNVGRDVEAE